MRLITCRQITGPAHAPAHRHAAEGHRGGHGDMLDPRQASESFVQLAVEVLAARLVVAHQTGVDLQQQAAVQVEAGIDVCRLERCADEESGGDQKHE